eukprot:5288575-Prymnesium_polylepis.1
MPNSRASPPPSSSATVKAPYVGTARRISSASILYAHQRLALGGGVQICGKAPLVALRDGQLVVDREAVLVVY